MKKIQEKTARDNAGMIQHAEDVTAACRMAAANLEAIDCIKSGKLAAHKAIWQLRKQAARKVEELQELAECLVIRLTNLK